MTATNASIVTAAAASCDTDTDGFLTVTELAALTGRTARNLRRAFRTAGNGTGQGSIYLVAVTDAHLYV